MQWKPAVLEAGFRTGFARRVGCDVFRDGPEMKMSGVDRRVSVGLMARRWFSIRVELLGGRGEQLWPYPGRVFAVGPAHTFADLARAIDNAFARWDLRPPRWTSRSPR